MITQKCNKFTDPINEKVAVLGKSIFHHLKIMFFYIYYKLSHGNYSLDLKIKEKKIILIIETLS